MAAWGAARLAARFAERSPNLPLPEKKFQAFAGPLFVQAFGALPKPAPTICLPDGGGVLPPFPAAHSHLSILDPSNRAATYESLLRDGLGTLLDMLNWCWNALQAWEDSLLQRHVEDRAREDAWTQVYNILQCEANAVTWMTAWVLTCQESITARRQ